MNPADGTEDRLLNFKIKIGANYQCPICWIEHGRNIALYPVPSGGRNDILRCAYGHDAEICLSNFAFLH